MNTTNNSMYTDFFIQYLLHLIDALSTGENYLTYIFILLFLIVKSLLCVSRSIGLPQTSKQTSYRSGSYQDGSYHRQMDELTDSHVETINYPNVYQYEGDNKRDGEPSPIPKDPTNESTGFDDDDLDIVRPETPAEDLANLRLAAARQTSVKEVNYLITT